VLNTQTNARWLEGKIPTMIVSTFNNHKPEIVLGIDGYIRVHRWHIDKDARITIYSCDKDADDKIGKSIYIVLTGDEIYKMISVLKKRKKTLIANSLTVSVTDKDIVEFSFRSFLGTFISRFSRSQIDNVIEILNGYYFVPTECSTAPDTARNRHHRVRFVELP